MVTGWQIRELQADSEASAAALSSWLAAAQAQAPLTDACTKANVDAEANWLQATLVDVLTRHAKPIRLCAYSKRWWNSEIKEARRAYAAVCKRF